MNSLEHIALGFAANASVLWILSQAGYYLPVMQNAPLVLAAAAAIALFSILPDVDSINSLASKLFRLFALLAAAGWAYEFFSSKSAFALAKAVFALLAVAGHFLYAKSGRMHRQFPHTFSFGALACVAVFLLTGSKAIAIASAIAFASHLIADWHFLAALGRDSSFFKKIF
ncbi:MAG TPA: metal-dependent hydrolase [Candidatus Norongarragalinales archaeon]|nr:metal-dependent hydrolase [Candidatus Norongarragalinales archaeon]